MIWVVSFTTSKLILSSPTVHPCSLLKWLILEIVDTSALRSSRLFNAHVSDRAGLGAIAILNGASDKVHYDFANRAN